WQVTANVDRGGDGVMIRVDARDGAGAPVTGVGFTARLARPTTTAEDEIVTLTETSPGIFTGTAPKIETGSWTVTLEADDGSERLYLSRNRITVK
ncbi:MAG: FixH family protein, partial [Hyphomicrobiales bacterium]|nr:FixH family protein [Hyphomicrobiales bacterium]